MTSKRANRYPPELRERAVRMLLEQRSEYRSEHAAINSIAPKIGCSPDTLRAWLRRSNDILRQASAYFAKAEYDRLWKK